MGACCSRPVADDVAHSSQIKQNSKPNDNESSKQPPAAAAARANPSANQEAQALAVRRRQMQKRIAVAAEAITTASDVEIPNVPKTDSSMQLIERAMAGNLLFQGLSMGARQAIAASMTPMIVKNGDVIIHQKDADTNKYYVVDRGTFEVWIAKGGEEGEGALVHTCTPGSGFGELALLYSAPRAATVKAASDGRLWVMERAAYAVIKHTLTQELRKQKRELIEGVPMLAMLAPEHKTTVADALELVEFEDGDVICREGEVGDRFYTIKEGNVSVSKGGKELVKLSNGKYFGERALIKAEPRGATVTAEGYVMCFALSNASFNDLLGPIEELWRYESLRKVPILSNLSERQLFELSRCIKPKEFAAGELLFRQGDPGDEFFVVEEGEFAVTNAEGVELARCGKGQCFGELALLHREPRAATITAAAPSKALSCSRENFDKQLGNLTEIQNMWRYEALSKVPLLAPLGQKQRLALCSAFKTKQYSAGEAVVTKGEVGDEFFVVEKGACAVFGDENKEINRLGIASYFGERSLLRREPRAATVRAAVDGTTLLAIDKAGFETLLGPLQETLQAASAEYDAALTTQKIVGSLSSKDLEHVAVLGAGAFGHVTLVKYKGRCYALKALSKAHVMQSGLAAHIKREKALQAEFASPFLVSLAAAFKDSSMLYMLLELVQGGEFFAHLQSKEGALLENEAKFYAACVVLGLEYMHDRGVAWRDLKPENLLLDTAGYLKITDFGFAKRIPPGSRSYTLCGTPEYLAPELVTQNGHGRAVDWWAVGVIIYEMVAGFPPFHQEDRVAMFRAICAAQFRLPDHFSPELKDLVKRLLVRVPNRRLGCMQGGAAEVKQHPWFAGFDWEALAQRKMKAPFVPKVRGADDASNFDATHVPPRAETDSSYASTGVFKDF